MNLVFAKLTASIDHLDERCIFVIVDSISALARDTGSSLERRRQCYELKARLEAAFMETGSELALTMFLAERAPGQPPDRSTLVEEYIVDTVFRLDVQEHAMGRRLRTLEILKSQGVNMALGEHSWAMVTNRVPDPLDRVHRGDFPGLIFEREFYGRAVREQALHKLDGSGVDRSFVGHSWGTTVIFPRVRPMGTGASAAANLPTVPKGKPHFRATGTVGLDEMLDWQGGKQFWYSAVSEPTPNLRGLKERSVTLLVGPPGTGKTTLLMQFALAAGSEDGSRAMFITFEERKEETIDLLANLWETMPKPKKPNASNKPPVVVYALSHAQIDLYLVISQLRYAVAQLRAEPPGLSRIAMDGLSEWLSTCNQGLGSDRDTSRGAAGLTALEALLGNLQTEGACGFPTECSAPGPFTLWTLPRPQPRPLGVTVMLAYETPIGVQGLPEEVVGMSAHNILALSQVHLAEATRRMIYVVKSRGRDSDPNPREVVFQRGKERPMLEIRPGFDEFAGLVEGNPCNARVVLQLFSENQSQDDWNWAHVVRLREIRDLDYELLNFHHTEIARTLEETDLPTHFPPSDLRIMEVDEWWIAHPNRTGDTKSSHPLLPLSDQWRPRAGRAELSSWREYWYGELEKALIAPLGAPADAPKRLHAIPGHMDFGMLCINIEPLAQLSKSRELPSAAAKRACEGDAALPFWDRQEMKSAVLLATRGATDRNKPFVKWDGAEVLAARNLWRTVLKSAPRRWIGADVAEMFTASNRDGLFTQLAELVTRPPSEQDPTTMIGLGMILCGIRKAAATADENSATESDPNSAPESESIRGSDLLPVWLFAFDTSGQETCACFFFELAWACGAGENFLIHDALRFWQAEAAKRNSANAGIPHANLEVLLRSPGDLPATHALFLLQYLVMTNLMPAGSDAHAAAGALFCRQWHSTLMKVNPGEPGHKPSSLMAAPFWPVAGHPRTAFEAALLDAEIRLARYIRRITDSLKAASNFFTDLYDDGQPMRPHQSILEQCQEYLNPAGGTGINLVRSAEELVEGAPGDPSDRRLERLYDISTTLAPLFDDAPEQSSLRLALNAAMPREYHGADPHRNQEPVAGFVDLAEMWNLHTLRLRILLAEASNLDLDSAVNGWDRSPLPAAADLEAALKCMEDGNGMKGSALAGSGASGSWMYAVHHSSRSVSIARDLIQELTSTRAVYERAINGAGIPPRKDFYQSWGNESVPSAEHLTWNEMLRLNLAHARRRDRVLCQGINAAEIYKLIREMVFRLLEFGDRNRWHTGMHKADFENRLRSAWNLAEQAISEILRTVANRMSLAGEVRCRGCRDASLCSELKKPGAAEVPHPRQSR